MHSLTIVFPNESTATIDRLSAAQAMELQSFWRSRGVLCFISSDEDFKPLPLLDAAGRRAAKALDAFAKNARDMSSAFKAR